MNVCVIQGSEWADYFSLIQKIKTASLIIGLLTNISQVGYHLKDEISCIFQHYGLSNQGAATTSCKIGETFAMKIIFSFSKMLLPRNL